MGDGKFASAGGAFSVTVLPVIARELQAQARQASTYYLRVLGAGLLVLALASRLRQGWPFSPQMGPFLFWALNRFFFWAIWLAVPLLTADCISREKREGTLGLLFLTPLTGRDIALAKSAIHALRALTFWAAALPVLVVPLLMGGVTAGDVVFSVLADGRALLLALAAGLLASAWCRESNRAFLLALVLSLSFAVAFHALEAFYIGRFGLGMSSGTFLGLPIGRRLPRQLVGFGAGSPALNEAWIDAIETAVALLSAALAVLLAARRIESTWQDKERTVRQQWWLQTFCTPVFWQGLFRRRMRRMLERNPIGWLQQYSWSARLIKWGWCLGLIVVECLLLTTGFGALAGAQDQLALVIPAGLVLSAAGSFRRERETGALELILVSPLRVGQIIGGRLRGIWGQFLPALLVLLLVWHAVGDTGWNRWNWVIPHSSWRGYDFVVQLLVTYLALPGVGLYFSLRCRHYLVGVALTVGVGLWLPWLAVAGLGIPLGMDPLDEWFLVTVGKLEVGLLALLVLGQALARRSFQALQSAG